MTVQYSMLFDLNRCTGCNACVVACKQENDLPPGTDAKPGETGFSFINVECFGPEGVYPDLSMYYQPTLCMHCAEPPCIDACPVEAIIKRDDGIVLIDKEACTGCEACLEACPYDAVSMDDEQGIARKCTLCAPLIDESHDPACAAACNAGAIIFGDVGDGASEISRLIRESTDDVFVLKPEMKTGPSMRYLQFFRKKD